MANTTNYNWETPDDTDLVKDGAAAIRTLGNSVDTTTKALNPETTLGDIAYRSATSNTNTRLPIGTAGQILAVSGGVPAWINNDQGDITEVQAGTGISVASGTGPIPVVTNTVATAYDAKGDLIVGTGADTFSRLAVGTNGQVLTADSSEATGLKFATPAGGGGALTFITSSTFTNVASATIDNCFTSTYNAYLIVIEQLGAATATDDIQFQLRYAGPTTQTAGYYGASGGGVYNQSTFTNIQNNNANQFTIGTETGSTSNEDSSGFMIISRVGASGIPSWTGQYTDSTQAIARFFGGTVDTSRTYTGILFKSASTNIDGIIRVYGLAKS